MLKVVQLFMTDLLHFYRATQGQTRDLKQTMIFLRPFWGNHQPECQRVSWPTVRNVALMRPDSGSLWGLPFLNLDIASRCTLRETLARNAPDMFSNISNKMSQVTMHTLIISKLKFPLYIELN